MEEAKRMMDKKHIIALFFGIIGGFLNGFLGAGGGIILLLALNIVNPPKGHEKTRDNFASVVAVVLMISTVSAVTYSHARDVDTPLLFLFALPGMAGGVLGAYLTDRLNTGYLKLFFAVLLVIAGINMVM